MDRLHSSVLRVSQSHKYRKFLFSIFNICQWWFDGNGDGSGVLIWLLTYIIHASVEIMEKPYWVWVSRRYKVKYIVVQLKTATYGEACLLKTKYWSLLTRWRLLNYKITPACGRLSANVIECYIASAIIWTRQTDRIHNPRGSPSLSVCGRKII